jgi:small subunit ribosomal protein S16
LVRLRLRRGGTKKKPFYWIVAADSRCKRDGKFLEKLGFYNPIAQGNAEKLNIDNDKVIDWYMKGARASDTVYSLMKKAGIVKKIHQIKYNRGGDDTVS